MKTNTKKEGRAKLSSSMKRSVTKMVTNSEKRIESRRQTRKNSRDSRKGIQNESMNYKLKNSNKSKKNGIIISLDNVWRIYKMGKEEVAALRGITLDVKQGEFLAIMGPSGSGKSTAVNMVGCLDMPTKGIIKLEGKDISKLSESDLAQIRGQKIGFIFQGFNLISTLTALENIMLPMTFQNQAYDVRKSRAEDLLNLVELGTRMGHRPTEMSGGQQQRVAIARSLANDPEIILADEPTGNLDSKTGTIVMEFLQKLHNERNKTIILVTHDPSLVKYADRIVYLKDGVIEKLTKKIK